MRGFDGLDRAISEAGFLAMGGQIVDATLVAAPTQRNSDGEKADIKAGRTPAGWRDKPAKLRQKDRDARWTVKHSRARRKADGARLREGLIDPNNTASDVWADTAYRSAANEPHLLKEGKVSRIHRRKPRGKPMPERTARAKGAKSKVRARVEHVFAEQKYRMGLTIRTIGIKRAEATITLVNMAYNMKRWCWLAGQREGTWTCNHCLKKNHQPREPSPEEMCERFWTLPEHGEPDADCMPTSPNGEDRLHQNHHEVK